ncbi:MAG: hypothetical protein CBC91_06360 [Rickettsiales bacterium TMED131]|nr:MAG: hypothetical protein CBC91_06360 [Rickettsiales bacterium TMED131]|tara:strand:+ start:102 stop:515 length:414 start_codon:yes stop_codon:yes gene_type:complete
MEYITDSAVPLALIPPGFRHPLAQQFEEIDEDGDLVRSYDEWGLASVLTYAYTRRVQKKADYATMELLIGECLEQSRHSTSENKALFRAIKRCIKAGDESETLGYSKVLISKIGLALAEQHEGMDQITEEGMDDEED